MRNELKIRRKVSAIVAMALAVVVTFFAALDSYGDASIDPVKEAELNNALAEAYEAIVSYEYIEVEEFTSVEVIKIFGANDRLVEEVMLEEGQVIEDEITLQLMNQAEFLSEYSNTKVYRLLK